ncbi:ABC transporter substrate-binding protein [Microvirga guangxiensis]|uniref:Iron complex transport system substrate-binding protein n=1 Tax=Microvirga guangxiensis TaxID=549386 RepID=A0A1G5EDD8_9HYPH|nr:ABC transporter substrate-binding protein [Microvirga guangxiensis]SCY24771.1 iron complex transport system substrate-binding protein [Microvirga guangxiensis]
MRRGLNRRECLAALLLPMAPAFAQDAGKAPPRVAIVDWGLTTSVLSLGITPAGIAEIDLYRRWADDFPISPDIQDVGLRTEPNLEVLASLKPDLILTTPFSENVRPLLERIAPTRSYATYTPDGHPLARSAQVLREIARELHAEARAQAVIVQAEATFTAARASLAGRKIPPLLLAGFMDGRHTRIYGADSLFGNVLDRLGLRNAWNKPTNFWGFSLVGIHELAPYAEAGLLAIAPIPPEAPLNASGEGLWRSLSFVRAGRVGTLPTTWAFGDVSTAERFARSLTKTLLDKESLRAG